MIEFIIFFVGLTIGIVIGMFRMASFFHKKKKRRIDCLHVFISIDGQIHVHFVIMFMIKILIVNKERGQER